MRVFFRKDLNNGNADLLAIQSVLSKYGCGLGSLVKDNPTDNCANDKTVVIAHDLVNSLVGGQTSVQFMVSPQMKSQSVTNVTTDTASISSPMQTNAVTNNVSVNFGKTSIDRSSSITDISNTIKSSILASPSQMTPAFPKTQARMQTLSSTPLPSLSEYNALVDLYNLMFGQYWTNHDNWSAVQAVDESEVQSVEDWYGVTVDPETGFVIGLNLGNNGLGRAIPTTFYNLVHLKNVDFSQNSITGGLISSISNLQDLETFDVNGNFSFGAVLPNELGSLSHLKILDFGGIDCSGTFPVSVLANLSSLEFLRISPDARNWSASQLTGVFPSSIAAGGNLKYLELVNCSFTGSIPDNFSQLTNLEYLHIEPMTTDISAPRAFDPQSYTPDELTGSLSVISQMSKLAYLSLRGHHLSGPIPDLTNLRNLGLLDLSYNGFGGVIPSSLSTLDSLYYLDLSYNGLTSSVPDLSQMTQLSSLYLNNNQLSGDFSRLVIPDVYYADIDISNNSFVGEINMQLGGYYALNLSNNKFTSVSPSFNTDDNTFARINFDDNQIAGPLPPHLAGYHTNGSISNNRLTFTDLVTLPTAFDDGGGVVAYSEDSVDVNRTYEVSIGGSLTLTTTIDRGVSPSCIYQWFKYVDGVNDIPLIPQATTAGYTYTLNNISTSDLSKYYYTIQNTDPRLYNFRNVKLVSKLQTISLPAGSAPCVPDHQKEYNALVALYNATQNNGGWTVKTGWDQGNINNISSWYGVTTDADGFVTSIVLPNNNLKGTLPTQLGNLCNIQTLVLSNNQLSGGIPASFANLKNMNEMDLDHNALTGPIPPHTLAALNNSPYQVDISYNQFSGDLGAALGDRWIYNFRINDNKFTYKDIVTVSTECQDEVTFTMFPQDSVETHTVTTLTAGSTLTLTASVDRSVVASGYFASACYYQWFKDGVPLPQTPTPSLSGYTVVIPNVSAADAGNYYYKITNDYYNNCIASSVNRGNPELISHTQTVKITSTGTTYNICLSYADTTSTLKPFNFNFSWNEVVARCMKNAYKEDSILVNYAIDKMLQDQMSEINETYRSQCLEGLHEHFNYGYVPKEYHYTLYYYDQGGQLTQTVPPKGVHPLTNDQLIFFLAGIRTEPAHELLTRYQHNSLNQVIWQQTPDAGISQLYYNDKSQLKLSQNAQQTLDKNYSYSKYDEQGRIIEVGEMNTATAVTTLQQQLNDTSFPSAANGTLSDVTLTHYDFPKASLQPSFAQAFLRTRVSYVEVIAKGQTDTVATFYSYDIHGNVKSLIQRIPGLRDKRTDYAYDLISGKVNYALYQYGQYDQFIHRYEYDADNRLRDVYTSSDAFIWDRDATYFYYLHGPLARVELGEYRVQGLDYYYTLQGWIKGVNMPYANDPGMDGYNGSVVGRDAFAYALGYYNGDYKPSNNTVTISDSRDQLWTRYDESMHNTGLFNGNISWMTTDLKKIGQQKGSRAKGMQSMVYQYDQLHRIVQSRSLVSYTPGSGFNTRNGVSPYDEDYTYDPNGNILTLQRNDDHSTVMDNFQYQYYAHTNRLREIRPASDSLVISSGEVQSDSRVYRKVRLNGSAYVPAGKKVEIRAFENIYMDNDFEAQDGSDFWAHIVDGPYQYDAIGNLTANFEKETQITWTPYGKVREVHVKNDTIVVKYKYDATGNRIEKNVVRLDSISKSYVTRYLHDAGGNVMAIYKDTTRTEQPIYGSARLGEFKGGRYAGERTLGERNYELSNHLGNILTVITDNVNMTTDSTWVSVVSASDYYPFGLTMKGRTGEWSAHEAAQSNIVLASDFNQGSYSPFTSDGTGVLSVDAGRLKLSGASLWNTAATLVTTVSGHQYSVSFDADVNNSGPIVAFVSDRTNNLASLTIEANGSYSYTFTATSVESVILFENAEASQRDFYLDNIIITDLTASGGTLVGNTEDVVAYRYGFNGKEKDTFDEAVYDYGFRIYNPRIAKFLSVDPLTKSYPAWSPYPFAMNSPVDGVDLDGLEYQAVTDKEGSVTSFLWDPDNAYDKNGALKSGYYERGITVEDRGTWKLGTWNEQKQRYDSYNIGSAKTTVYSYTKTKDEKGNIVKSPIAIEFNGSSMPSDPTNYGTLAPGFYKAVNHSHHGRYPALQLQTTSGSIQLPAVNGNNPRNGKSYVEGVNFHYSGSSNFTGTFWDKETYSKRKWGYKISEQYGTTYSGASEACQLIDYKCWEDFMEQFPTDVGAIGVIIKRQSYDNPNARLPTFNPDEAKILNWDSYSDNKLFEAVKKSYMKKTQKKK